MRPFLLVLAVSLSACGPSGEKAAQARFTAHQAQVDPPALWLVERLNAEGAVLGQVWVCSDTGMQEGLARTAVLASGQPCLVRKAVERDGRYSAQCEAGGVRLTVHGVRTGDPQRAFATDVVVKMQPGGVTLARQTLRYSRKAACPPGWIIGDQARPGQARGRNALGG